MVPGPLYSSKHATMSSNDQEGIHVNQGTILPVKSPKEAGVLLNIGAF